MSWAPRKRPLAPEPEPPLPAWRRAPRGRATAPAAMVATAAATAASARAGSAGAPAATARAAAGPRTPKQRAGDAAEQAACAHLQAHGCRVLARNARFREGELDIVAQQGELLLFVEVRLRAGSRFGGAGASVDAFKRRRLVRAAQHFLLQHYGGGARTPPCRFDVITADGDGIRDWIRDAFAAD